MAKHYLLAFIIVMRENLTDSDGAAPLGRSPARLNATKHPCGASNIK
jgi:hypothetical protein